ncbi:MAG: Smr/MutS family protein, partial [Candidatus Rokubacteria bacterium]|nr:Smr/MutS family protein [Candidatus Rokubacteria bacterium]
EHTRSEAERTLAIEGYQQEAAARLAAAREIEGAATDKAREIVERAKREAAAMLGEIRRAVSGEWDKLKRSERSRRDLDQTRRRLSEVTARVVPAAPQPAADAAGLALGATVAAEHLGLRGKLVKISGDTATVEAGAMTVRVPLVALRPAAGDVSNGRLAPGRGEPSRANVVLSEEGSPRPGANRVIAAELMLIGRRTDEARDMVEQYLDDAFMAGLPTVRLVHGKGTGALRKAVRDLLSAHPLVDSFRDGEPFEGGTGATVAALKGSA